MPLAITSFIIAKRSEVFQFYGSSMAPETQSEH
jgi:hypothetical protein